MAIGTSLGAFYESEFHHQAGIATPPPEIKPKDTGDDNVIPPDDSMVPSKDDEAAKVLQVSDVRPYSMNPMLDTQNNTDLRAPVGGGRLKEAPPAEEPIEPARGPDPFQQFMAGRGSRQTSNIVNGEEQIANISPPAIPRSSIFTPQDLLGQHPDHMSDEDFLRWGEYQPYGPTNPMTEAQSDRWHRLSREEGQRTSNYNDDDYRPSFTEEDLVNHYDQNRTQEIKDRFQEASDKVVTKGNISVLKNDNGNSYRDQYNFLSSDGVPGELSISPKNDGKELHVNWIGTIGTLGPMDVGRSEMKNLFKLLADQYPKAEKITGFRVTGARMVSGSGSNDAEMRIPGRGSTKPGPQRKSPQQLLSELLDSPQSVIDTNTLSPVIGP